MLRGHKKGVNAVIFSPDGSLLASGSDDKLIRLWRTDDWSEIRTIEDHRKGVNSLAFLPTGHTLVSCSDDNSVRSWDVESGREVKTITGLDSWDGRVMSVATSPDGRFLAYSTRRSFDEPEEANSIQMLRTHDYQRVWSSNRVNSVGQVVFSPEGDHLAAALYIVTGKYSAFSYWFIFEAESGKEVIHTGEPGIFAQDMRSLVFSPDGKVIVTGHGDGDVEFWDVRSGNRMWNGLLDGCELQKDIYALAFSPDGRYLAGGGKDKQVVLWDFVGSRP